MEVTNPSLLRSYVIYRDLIHGMLAHGPVRDEYSRQMGQLPTHGIATATIANISYNIQYGCGIIPAYVFDVEMIIMIPSVTLIREQRVSHRWKRCQVRRRLVCYLYVIFLYDSQLQRHDHHKIISKVLTCAEIDTI
jgi:hypothetical protein